MIEMSTVGLGLGEGIIHKRIEWGKGDVGQENYFIDSNVCKIMPFRFTVPRSPLQQKPALPTSYPKGPFSEQAFASARLGGKIGIEIWRRIMNIPLNVYGLYPALESLSRFFSFLDGYLL